MHRTVFVLLLIFPTLLAQTHGQTEATPQAESLRIPATNEGLPGSGPIRRYDWFQKLWLRKRSEWADRVDKDQGAVVFLGDSITQGWGGLDKAFPGLKVANRGISGDTTRGMLIRLKQDVLSLKPRGVVMLMGTNDLEENAEPGTVAANVALIVAALQKHNAKMPVVLCRVFPSSATKKRPADKIRAINGLFQKLVRTHPQVTLLDTWTLFADEKGDARKGEFPDLLHPNAKGYAKWAAALRPVLATLGFIETGEDDFRIEAGYESLFNGRDLTGWGFRKTPEREIKAITNWRKRDKNAPAWPIIKQPVAFDGRRMSNDGRYLAHNGRLIVRTPSEGRRIQQLWTTEEFAGDFTLKLEFRATPNADSGVFIRGRQLQCRDYLLAGPYRKLTKYKPQQWNELVITVKGNTARCTCNGEVLEEAYKLPEAGPIGLEGDRGQMEYRRIRIRRKGP